MFCFAQIWNIKPGWGSRPDIHIAGGHSDEITGFKFSSDGRTLLSRSFDGSLKVLVCLLKNFLFEVILSNFSETVIVVYFTC